MVRISTIISMGLIMISCGHNGYKENVNNEAKKNILFFHHSTGNNIYRGLYGNKEADVQLWFDKKEGINLNFVEQAFPKSKVLRYIPGYGWNNYPYDYYNIWVKNGDKKSFKYEPTLKTLTPLWDVIVFKHCFPVSSIEEGDSEGDVNSSKKTLPNYKLQYKALKEEMKKYPKTKFVVWTGAALVEEITNETSAQLAQEFFTWVKNEWDNEGDNIYVWDFYELETEGGLYLKKEYAYSETNSHPNKEFSAKVAPLFCQRVVDVALNDGTKTNLKGEMLGDSVIVNGQ